MENAEKKNRSAKSQSSPPQLRAAWSYKRLAASEWRNRCPCHGLLHPRWFFCRRSDLHPSAALTTPTHALSLGPHLPILAHAPLSHQSQPTHTEFKATKRGKSSRLQ